MKEWLICICVIFNALVFIMYGLDKYKSRRKKRRISELTLILPSYTLCSLGAMLGMIVFNHKTSKTKFRIFIPIAFLENIIILYLLYLI